MRIYEIMNRYDRNDVLKRFGSKLWGKYGKHDTPHEILKAIEDQDDSKDKKNTIRTVKRLLATDGKREFKN